VIGSDLSALGVCLFRPYRRNGLREPHCMNVSRSVAFTFAVARPVSDFVNEALV
jgi:hypothetical protein